MLLAAAPPLAPVVAPPSHRAQVLAFLAVGGVTTALYSAVFALASPHVGGQPANTLALLLTADLNTAANRRLTFAAHGAAPRGLRQRLQGSAAFAVTWLATSAALAAFDASGSTDTALRWTVLLGANALAGALHFVLLRDWAFRRRR